MHAQVVHFTLKPGHSSHLSSMIKEWRASHSKDIAGFRDIHLWQDAKFPDRGTIVVTFDDAKHLKAFSEHPVTLDLFNKAKGWADGEPDYFEATLVKHE
jgi:heme-degrading monooxygenase HmoA